MSLLSFSPSSTLSQAQKHKALLSEISAPFPFAVYNLLAASMPPDFPLNRDKHARHLLFLTLPFPLPPSRQRLSPSSCPPLSKTRNRGCFFFSFSPLENRPSSRSVHLLCGKDDDTGSSQKKGSYVLIPPLFLLWWMFSFPVLYVFLARYAFPFREGVSPPSCIDSFSSTHLCFFAKFFVAVPPFFFLYGC